MFLKMKTKNTMKNNYADMPNGYQETIQKGISFVRYSDRKMSVPSAKQFSVHSIKATRLGSILDN